MAIFKPVMFIFSEILALPDFMKSPFLCLGVQGIEKSFDKGYIPEQYDFDTFGDLCRSNGMQVDELDPFDNNANIKWNLNNAVPEWAYEKYSTVLDYGCIEHIFDTKTVIENCMRMVKVGGLYAIHTPVRNFADHGLHTFSTELFPRVMAVNGFELIYERYTTSSGRDVDIKGEESVDVIGWYVGKKLQPLVSFISPEQKRYSQNE